MILLTDLFDDKRFDVPDLLKLYRKRWGIERMFQQVTRRRSRAGAPDRLHAAGDPVPVRAVPADVQPGPGGEGRCVARDGKVEFETVSTYGVFYDLKRELHAWAYLGNGDWPTRAGRDARQMARRLRGLLSGSWDPIAYAKASDKTPRKKKPPPTPIPGGHTSVQRLLAAAAAAAAAARSDHK